MSVTPPEQPLTEPAKQVGRLTILGILIFFAGAILARVLRVPPGTLGDTELAGDVGDLVKTLGIVLASFGGPLPIPEALKRLLGSGGSKVLMALLVGGVLTAGSTLPGCALLERRQVECTEPPESVLEDLPDGTCALRGFCDGHELWTAIGPGPCGEVEERRAPPVSP